MLLTIIAFVLVLGVLVLVHELGHFWAARRFGVRSEEFGIGFPPRLFGWYKNKEGSWKFVLGKGKVVDPADTVYSINSIPLGGFVKIVGENGDDRNDPSSMASKPAWQRFIILSAGVFMNVVLAVVIFTVLLGIGSPQALDRETLPANAVIGEVYVQVADLEENSPAMEANVLPNDIIVSVDGLAVNGFDSLNTHVKEKVGQPVEYVFKRGDEFLEKTITPVIINKGDQEIAGIGVGIFEMAHVRLPWHTALVEGTSYTGFFLKEITVGLGKALYELVSSGKADTEVVGPLGIASLTGDMARMGFAYLAQFTAILSLHLAIINFIPFPALDGGRVLFLLIEKIKGSPIRKQTEAIFHNIGFLLLMLLIVIVTFKDAFRFFQD
ncbi:MAG: site-2 protease family protein [Patescibacteria group bacterium]|nr:MAG: site-2 protease family protein [Patescibacteria group bacterium]